MASIDIVTFFFFPIFFISLFILFVLPPAGIAYAILKPMGEAAKGRKHPAQYTILDFLGLFVFMQMTWSVMYWYLVYHQETDLDDFGLCYLFSGILCLAIWVRVVQIMSRAGVHRPLHRSLFLVVVIPSTIASSIAVVFAPFVTVDIMISILESDFTVTVELSSCVATVLLALFIDYKLTRYIVLSANPITDESQTEPEIT